MKAITTVLGLVLISLTVIAGDLKDIEISGFRAIEVTGSMIKLSFRSEKPFVISKEKFSSEEQAKVFCKQNGLNLDTKGFEKTLLLAMSGAATLNEEIKQAIIFKLDNDDHGIWAWSGSSGQVTIMFDGRGTGTVTIPMEEIASAAQKLGNPQAATINAICE